LPQRKPERYTLFAELHQNQHQTKTHKRTKKAELEILPAARKVIEVPVILSPRTDCGQHSYERNEDATIDGSELKGAVRERSPRIESLFQSILSMSSILLITAECSEGKMNSIIRNWQFKFRLYLFPRQALLRGSGQASTQQCRNAIATGGFEQKVKNFHT
jgi:hypothetical protein